MATTLSSQYIETKKYAWWSNAIKECSVDLSPLPEEADLAKQVDKFLNVEDDERETIKEGDEGGREV